MPKIEERLYCIHQNEWEILMVKAGIENCFGLVFHEEQQEKEEIIYTLYQMVRKGMLCVNNEKMEIAFDYVVWIEPIKKTREAIHFRKRQEEGWEHGFAYIGERIIVFTCSETRKNTFDVRILEKKNWISFLWEMELFPSYRTEGGSGKMEEVLIEQKESCERLLEKKVTTIVAKIDIEKKQETEWVAFGEEEGAQFLLWQKETTKRMPYTMENLKNILA